jgi:hypothetical protein
MSSGLGNDNLSAVLMLKAIKEFRGFVGGTSNSLMQEIDLSGQAGKKNLLENLVKAQKGSDANNVILQEFQDVKDNYLFDLLDNTTGAFFLKDIVTGKAFKYKNEDIEKHKYFVVAYEDMNSDENFVMADEDGKPLSIAKMVQPLKATYRETPIDSFSKDPDFLKDDPEDATKKIPITGNFAEVDYKPDSVYVNKALQAPGRKYPSLGAIVIKKHGIGLPAKNAEHLNIFFNAIPSLELSRCVPYINIAVVSRKEEERAKNMNLVTFMRFIKSEENSFVLDENIGIKTGNPEGFGNIMVTNDFSLQDLPDISLMDIFTSPQTLSNANVNKDIALNLEGTPYGNKILEPISPFLSLENLSIDISGMGVALFASKVGSMNLKLHDRSRLSDISQLVAANQFGTTKVVIEFGWSHPEGGPESNNAIGQYLNALRDRGIYTVKASNFNFGDGNTVSISLALACFGGQESKTISAAAGSQIPLKTFSSTIKKINSNIQKQFLEDNAGKKTSELKEVRHLMRVGQRNSLSSTSLITYEQYTFIIEAYEEASKMKDKKEAARLLQVAYAYALQLPDLATADNPGEIVDKQKKENDENTTKLLYGKLYALKFSEPERKEAQTAQANQAIVDYLSADNMTSSQLQEQNMSMAQNPGPYTVVAASPSPEKRTPIDFYKNAQTYFGKNKSTNKGAADFSLNTYQSAAQPGKLVSLGKIFMSFIGHPLAMSGLFDEVQMVFYPLNTNAGAARIHTTASMPIEVELLERRLMKRLSKNVNMSVNGFFNFIESKIIRDKGILAYGISQEIRKNKTAIEGLQAVIEAQQAEKKINTETIPTSSDLNEDETTANLLDRQKAAAATAEEANKLLDVEIKKINESIKKIRDDQKDEVSKILQDIYKKDDGPPAEPKFTRPNLSLFIETLTGREPSGALAKIINFEDKKINFNMSALKASLSNLNNSTANGFKKSICRVHIYDENASANPRAKLIQSMITEGNTGKILIKSDAIISEFKTMAASKIKLYVKRAFPSITYGANNSTVQNISISSNVSDQVSQVIQITSYANRNNPQDSGDPYNDFEEVTVVPASVELKMIGMPFIHRGNQIYIDFGTNTTLDNVYTVKSVNHSISAGRFETSVSLIYAGQGDTRSIRKEIIDTIKIIAQ